MQNCETMVPTSTSYGLGRNMRRFGANDPKQKQVAELFEYSGGALAPRSIPARGVSTHTDGRGYVTLRMGGRALRRSRLTWIWHNGGIPAGWVIDHINGVRDDDRIENLRVVPSFINNRNTKLRKDNTSGVVGVSKCPRSGKWRADIRLLGRLTCLGMFDDFDDAVAARKKAEQEHNFHPNHGRS